MFLSGFQCVDESIYFCNSLQVLGAKNENLSDMEMTIKKGFIDYSSA